MKAQVGDWLVVKVRWLDTEREALVFPGSDAVIVSPQEQRVADQRANVRITALQSEIG